MFIDETNQRSFGAVCVSFQTPQLEVDEENLGKDRLLFLLDGRKFKLPALARLVVTASFIDQHFIVIPIISSSLLQNILK
jgi:hypothetical protein